MKNQEKWSPSKFVFEGNNLKGSRDKKELSVSSRLVADIVALYYQKYLPTHVKGDLLDLGCGKVPFLQLYRSYATRITCVDWQNTFHKNIFLDAECDLNVPLPFDTSSFDTIILSDVLEHIREPEVLWSEMARILRLNGKIILNTPFFYKLHEVPFDYYRHSEFSLKHFADKNNLTIDMLEAMGGWPEIISDLMAKQLVRVPLAGKSIASFVQWTCWQLLKTEFGKRLSRGSSKHYPLGYFMIVSKQG